MNKLNKGYIQIYTGNGKGKTTAALGQAVRAAGHGLRTCIIQFMKEYPYGELEGLKSLEQWITVEQYCGDDFVYRRELPPPNELEKAQAGLRRAESVMLGGGFDIIILDEVCVSIYFGLIKTNDVLRLLDLKPEKTEIILTGRYCPPELIKRADLVTEMKEVKHYYSQGVLARKGIES